MNTILSRTVSTQPTLLRTRLKATRTILLGTRVVITVSTALPSSQPIKAVKTQVVRNSFWKKILDKVAVAAIAIALIVGAAIAAPQLYFAFVPADTIPVQASEEGTPLGGEFAQGVQATKEEVKEQSYLPPKDETLPEGKWIIIPRIGVRTQLQETEEAEEALKTGVWKVPGYGEAGSTDLPMILAAHRFGWEWWWQSDYWKYHSFYLLPDTEPGDIVEIIDDQRKWTYEIYGGGEGDNIDDYNADMILYTCKFLNSPIRHFRYARLVNLDSNSQES